MLSVQEINKLIESKQRDKIVIYEKVLEMCNKYIYNYAKCEQYRCFYEVPEFILGTPLYNLNNAISYIVDKLKIKGFLVHYYFPKFLYISWDKDEITGKKKPDHRIPIHNPQIAHYQNSMVAAQIAQTPKPPSVATILNKYCETNEKQRPTPHPPPNQILSGNHLFPPQRPFYRSHLAVCP
jgi:hypothetical protein